MTASTLMPITITIPTFPPPEFPVLPEEIPHPPILWIPAQPKTWVHDPIPVELPFPLFPTEMPFRLPLRIEIAGHIFETELAINTQIGIMTTT